MSVKKQGTPPLYHTIEAGDTFSDLAFAYYGDGSDANAQKIQAANSTVDPRKLQVGEKIYIPA